MVYIIRRAQMVENKTYPAGRYYVGDLCYARVLGGARWNAVVDLMYAPENDGNGGSLSIDGIDFWYHNTAYGDGVFYDGTTGLEFGVDAGIIGILSAEVAETDEIVGGHIVEFAHSFTPHYEGDTFYIGHLVIYTGWMEEDEDEEESEDEEKDEDFEADEEKDEDEDEDEKPAKKEVAKSTNKSSTSKSKSAISIALVEAVKETEPAIQFADGSYVKLNDKDFRIWLIREIREIKEAIG